METRKTLVTKLGFFTAVAISIIIIGKKHIAHRKDSRHLKESALSVENELDDFLTVNRRPGFPEHNPNLNYDTPNRKSKYVGAGLSYSSRTPGDKLSIWNVMFKRRDDDK
ncbi:hypothetical protein METBISCDRAFT_16201 [Metschnikowia bicuspidata]|uniref:Uncharacterized protein n=1 Tax=Metschnikowia bicuspidata TaxID=27322 RepID=A0A4V1J313_9ASCO|nr:hypothetical protein METBISCDRAFT_16201 [Metschnikowia bicuspidata]